MLLKKRPLPGQRVISLDYQQHAIVRSHQAIPSIATPDAATRSEFLKLPPFGVARLKIITDCSRHRFPSTLLGCHSQQAIPIKPLRLRIFFGDKRKSGRLIKTRETGRSLCFEPFQPGIPREREDCIVWFYFLVTFLFFFIFILCGSS